MRRPSLELTRRGWGLLGAGFGLLVAGRLLGALELVVLAVATLTLLAGAALWVRTRDHHLAVDRSIRPDRIHVDAMARVDLDVVARGATPQLTLTDVFDNGARAARFLVPALAPGQNARAAYRLPTGHRGRFTVGPALVGVLDPFGVARRSIETGGTDEVTVCPRVHALSAPLGVPGTRPAWSRTTAPFHVPSPHGDELLTLREYQVGDDLRRIHWRSTARVDELVVRQDETQWQPRTTIVLDTRATAFDLVAGSAPGTAAFEVAVEAVASLAAHLARDGQPFTVQARGRVLGAASGRRHGNAVLGRILDELAVIAVDRRGTAGSGRDVSRDAGREAGAGLVVLVTGRASTADAEQLRRLGRPGAPTVLVATLGPVAVPTGGTLTVVDASSGRFAAAWDEAMLRRARPSRRSVRSRGPLR